MAAPRQAEAEAAAAVATQTAAACAASIKAIADAKVVAANQAAMSLRATELAAQTLVAGRERAALALASASQGAISHASGERHYTKADLCVALKVQAVLMRTPNLDKTARFIELPSVDKQDKFCGETCNNSCDKGCDRRCGDTCDKFHRQIYEKLLEPCNIKVTNGQFVAYFYLLTPTRLQTLRHHLSCIIEAFEVIKRELLPLKGRADSHFDVQLSIINDCLLAHLNKMSRDMPWHKESAALYIERSKSSTALIQEIANSALLCMSPAGLQASN